MLMMFSCLRIQNFILPTYYECHLLCVYFPVNKICNRMCKLFLAMWISKRGFETKRRGKKKIDEQKQKMITIDDFAVCTFFLFFVIVVVVVVWLVPNTHIFFSGYIHFFYFFIYYINFFYNSKRVFGIQTTLLKCGQMFPSLRVCTKPR